MKRKIQNMIFQTICRRSLSCSIQEQFYYFIVGKLVNTQIYSDVFFKHLYDIFKQKITNKEIFLSIVTLQLSIYILSNLNLIVAYSTIFYSQFKQYQYIRQIKNIFRNILVTMEIDPPSAISLAAQTQFFSFLSSRFYLQASYETPINISLSDRFLIIQEQPILSNMSSNQTDSKKHTYALNSLIFQLIGKSEINPSISGSKNFIENFIGFRFIGQGQTDSVYCNDQNTRKTWLQILKEKSNQKGFREMFKPIRKIYQSSNYSTFIVQRMIDNQRFLAKTFSKERLTKSQNARENVLNYIKILRTLNHPFFQKLEGVYESDSAIYITCYQQKGISLQQYIHSKKSLTENKLIEIFQCLLKGLMLLKQKQIVHRDIQLKNIFISNFEPVEIIITGFDQAIQLQPKSIEFAALISTQSKQYQYAIDIYSLGVSLYFLMLGTKNLQKQLAENLFNLDNLQLIKQKLVKQTNFSSKLIDLIVNMLHKNLGQRITAQIALNALINCKSEKMLSATCSPQDSQSFYENFGEQINSKFLHGKERKISMQI